MDIIRTLTEYYSDTRGKMELSAKEQEQKERMEAAYSMLTKGHPHEFIAGALSKRYGISRIQGRRDVANCITLYGDVTRSSKEGHRNIATQMALRAFTMARKAADVDGMNRAISNIIKLQGLDRDDPEMPNFEKLQAHNYEIALPEGMQEALQQMLNGGKVDLSKFLTSQAEDAEILEPGWDTQGDS